VKGKKSGVFKGNDRVLRSRNKGRKGERSIRLVNLSTSQEYTKVSRIGQLLLMIHQKLCIYS